MRTTYGSVDFFVEVGLLQLERPRIVLDLRVGVVLDVHGRLFALSLANSRVSISLQGESFERNPHENLMSVER